MARHWRRIWLFAAGVAFAGVTAAVVAWIVWDRRIAATIESALAHVEAAGLPLECEQIEAWLDATYGPIDPDSNGGAKLLEAIAAIIEARPPTEWTWDVDSSGKLPGELGLERGWVENNSERYEQLERALTAERFRFAIDWSAGMLVKTPRDPGIETAFDILQMRIAVRITDGDLHGAIADIRVHAALGNALREVPVKLDQLVCIMRRVKSTWMLRRVLVRADDPHAAFVEAGIEPAIGGSVAALATEPARLLRSLAFFMGMDTGLSPGLARLHEARGKLALHVVQLVDAYGIVKGPTADAAVRADALMERDAPREGGVFGRVSVSEWLGSELSQRAELLVTEIGVDALDHRRRTGHWPSVEELPTRPVDPLSGAPLAIATDGDALTLELGRATWRIDPSR